MKILLCILCCLAMPLVVAAGEGPKTPRDKPLVEFHNGERIALVGNEFFEREQDRAYIETQLTSRFPRKNLTFRNLGYSGDTVWANARNLCAGWAVFGPPDQGFKRLTHIVNQIKPTLILVAYGMNESFDGPSGVAHFRKGLDRMLDMLAGTGARIVLISPIRHENLGSPLPDPAAHNHNIRLYCDAMRNIARQRGYAFIDLFDGLEANGDAVPRTPLTSDGIHLTPYGYRQTAAALERAFGYTPRTWRVSIDAGTGKTSQTGTTLSDVKANARAVSFDATDDVLPLAPPSADTPAKATVTGADRLLRIIGLAPGTYALKADDQTIATGTAAEWARGIQLRTGPAYAQEEALRKLILMKNFDFFNYWRPENDTYIFGYRKHEQGRHAAEMPEFQAMVAPSEAKIAGLRGPVRHAYVLGSGR